MAFIQYTLQHQNIVTRSTSERQKELSRDLLFLHGEWLRQLHSQNGVTNFFNMELDGKTHKQNVLFHYMFRGTQG